MISRILRRSIPRRRKLIEAKEGSERERIVEEDRERKV